MFLSTPSACHETGQLDRVIEEAREISLLTCKSQKIPKYKARQTSDEENMRENY
jgi:hypothetical protein